MIVQWMGGRPLHGLGMPTNGSSMPGSCWWPDGGTSHRVALRYDEFSVQLAARRTPASLIDEDGQRLLRLDLAARDHVEVAAEWLEIDSDHTPRVLSASVHARGTRRSWRCDVL